MYRTGDSKNNLLSYRGLVDTKIRSSDIDLPVQGLLKENFSLYTDQNMRGPLPPERVLIPMALHFFLGRVQAAVKLGRFYHVWSRNNF